MNFILSVCIFVASAALLYVCGSKVVDRMVRLSRAFRVREFVLAFFVMAAAASLPNLFVGITSALDGIPELSLGDIFGNNIIALTIGASLAVLFSPKKEIDAKGKTVETTAAFTFVCAILPMVLFLDGNLSRADGLILMIFFVFYARWLMSRHERFSKTLAHDNGHHKGIASHLTEMLKDVFFITINIGFMMLASFGVVYSASFFAEHFGITLALVGLLITGLGNALPEIYFAIISARRGETSLILGGLMGSVIFPTTLVLGLVAFIHPISIEANSAIMTNRIFVLAAATLFYVFTRTSKKISVPEALILMGIYAAFLWRILQ